MDLPGATPDRQRNRALGQWQTGRSLETGGLVSHPRQAEAIRAPEYSVLFVIGSMLRAVDQQSALLMLAPFQRRAFQPQLQS
jgi:hypothetical protein